MADVIVNVIEAFVDKEMVPAIGFYTSYFIVTGVALTALFLLNRFVKD